MRSTSILKYVHCLECTHAQPTNTFNLLFSVSWLLDTQTGSLSLSWTQLTTLHIYEELPGLPQYSISTSTINTQTLPAGISSKHHNWVDELKLTQEIGIIFESRIRAGLKGLALLDTWNNSILLLLILNLQVNVMLRGFLLVKSKQHTMRH